MHYFGPLSVHFFPNRVKRQLKENRFQTSNFPRQDSFNFAMKTIRGYTEIRGEQLDKLGKPDLKEVLDIGFVNKTSKNIRRNKRHYLGENIWPSDDKNLKQSIEKYAEKAALVAHNVLNLLAEGLGAKAAFDDTFNEDALQVQRLTKYPASDNIEDKKQG